MNLPSDPVVTEETTNVELADEIRRSLRWLIAFTVVLYLAMAGVVGYVYVSTANSKEALCAYQEDLNNRVKASELFLKENPNGIPGVSLKTFQTNLDNQRKAAESFGIVNC